MKLEIWIWEATNGDRCWGLKDPWPDGKLPGHIQRVIKVEPVVQHFTFSRLQEEQRPWVEHNFPKRKAHHPLLGVQEEVGELSHAHLKAEQGIRVSEDHEDMGKDAVGDITIFLADYCSAMGWDFEECVKTTWDNVKKRDWIRFPKNGLNE